MTPDILFVYLIYVLFYFFNYREFIVIFICNDFKIDLLEDNYLWPCTLRLIPSVFFPQYSCVSVRMTYLGWERPVNFDYLMYTTGYHFNVTGQQWRLVSTCLMEYLLKYGSMEPYTYQLYDTVCLCCCTLRIYIKSGVS